MDALPTQPAILVLSSGFGAIFYPPLSLREVRHNWQVPPRVCSEMKLLMNPSELPHPWTLSVWCPSSWYPRVLPGHTTPPQGQMLAWAEFHSCHQMLLSFSEKKWWDFPVLFKSCIFLFVFFWCFVLFFCFLFFQLVKTPLTGLCLRKLFS